ncbi:MAG: universal stress protein [Ramlibacter sp.]
MKILVATDGSKASLNAVKYAANLLRKLTSATSSITLISVHDDAGLAHAKAIAGRKAVADYLHDMSDKQLKSAKKLLEDAEITHKIEVRVGHVAKEIVGFATTGKFDMIVLGAKGRSTLSDMLLGSVAQRVLSMAGVPVLLVR